MQAVEARLPRRRIVGGLAGGAESLYCARAVCGGGRALFIARDLTAAAFIAGELKFFAPELPVAAFPDWELLPYDEMQPPAELASRRLAVLRDLCAGKDGVVVAAVSAVLGPLPPAEFVAARAFSLRRGGALDRAGLLSQLARGGYDRCDRVRAPGEFAVCGGQIDLYPAGGDEPYRLVLADDEIEEIRAFDPETQRSARKLEKVEMLPAREFLLDDEFAARFRANLLARFDASPAAAGICRDLRRGIAPPGAPFYLPLFYDGARSTLLDYLPADARVFVHAEVPAAVAEFWRAARVRYEALCGDGRPLLPPAELFMRPTEFKTALTRFAVTEFAADAPVGLSADLSVDSPADSLSDSPEDSLFAADLPADGGLRRLDSRFRGNDGEIGKDGEVQKDEGIENDGEIRKSEDVGKNREVENGAEIENGIESGGLISARLPDLALDLRSSNPAVKLAAFARGFDGRVVVAVDTESRRDALFAAVARAGLAPCRAGAFAAAAAAPAAEGGLALVVAPLRGGFVFREQSDGGRVALVSEAELYGAPPPPRARRESGALRAAGGLAEIAEIRPGDAVVHRNHGVGVYRGLKTITAAGARAEFIELEYAGGDKLLAPIAHLDFISRYHGGDGGEVVLHKLGSAKWRRQKAQAAARARDAAARMLEIHARRAAVRGRGFAVDESALRLFAQRAGFEETPDQTRAIEEVVRDLQADAKMDRLICGDVGFGKTEVALRAAFIAAANRRQTALLAPTTLLAEQHHRSFVERFAGLPVRIAKLTRAAGDAAATVKAAARGEIDIVIGTHKLLGKSVRWRDLGLVVIDEEHRFGVRHKEHFKALRADADILSLSATPIPRTLSLALDGARDFSAIATAPRGRLAVKTVVARYSGALLQEALDRELRRGGQAFFIHNDIAAIGDAADDIRALAPKARVGIAHGRLPPAALEDVMRRFARRELDILAATTIIESGLHIANANTIVVNRADNIGLAQLHQLRGRVGRAERQGYAYFFYPAFADKLPPDAAARLTAISEMSALGSGFWIARRDLEIRGAGEILGEKQSGEIAAVGLEMYQSLLASAVQALKKSPAGDAAAAMSATDLESTIDLGAPALLPEDFCGGVGERLRLYRRLAAGADDQALFLLREELEDRFGRLPPPAALLIEAHRLRLRARQAGAAAISAREEGVTVSFIADPPNAAALHSAIRAGRARPLSGERIKLTAASGPDPFMRARLAADFLDSLRA